MSIFGTMKTGYAVSLTSVPPRFERLGPMLRALLAQDPSPERVLLCVAERYARYPGPVTLPDLPIGVDVLWTHDIGPATKVLPAAQVLAGSGLRLIYCDDDWIAGPGWAAALLKTGGADTAVTGQGFTVDRLGRTSNAAHGDVDIAQGFSGVSLEPDWISDAVPPGDLATRSADDIWLSGHLAQAGVAIRACPAARAALHLAFGDDEGLQQADIGGASRAEANQRAVEWVWKRYGLWPRSGRG